jgi:hypothetical protein
MAAHFERSGRMARNTFMEFLLQVLDLTDPLCHTQSRLTDYTRAALVECSPWLKLETFRKKSHVVTIQLDIKLYECLSIGSCLT